MAGPGGRLALFDLQPKYAHGYATAATRGRTAGALSADARIGPGAPARDGPQDVAPGGARFHFGGPDTDLQRL